MSRLRIKGALKGATALALFFIALGAPPAFGLEAGADLSEQSRQRLHKDTGSYDSTFILRDISLFVEDKPADNWQWKVRQLQRNWRLEGTGGQPLINLNVTQTEPSVVYQNQAVYLKGVVIRSAVSEGDALYTRGADYDQTVFWLPGVDLKLGNGDPYLWKLGAWRELDFHPYANNYTPLVYQGLYGGWEWKPEKSETLEVRLTHIDRVYPDDLALTRNETEVDYRMEDPLGKGEGGAWRMVTLKLAEWHYTNIDADIWYLTLENDFRFKSGSVSHALGHRLVSTNNYTVFKEGLVPDSLVEVDEPRNDFRQRLKYDTWGKIGETRMYWRGGMWLDHSIAKKAYKETRLSLGLTMGF